MPIRRPLLGALSLTCALAACTNGSSSANDPEEASATEQSAHLLKPTSGIRGISEDREGNFYFHSPDWTAKYDASARENGLGGFTYFTSETQRGLVGGFQEDAKGLLWAQGVDGIQSFDGEKFSALPQQVYDSKSEWAMASGDLWFGSDHGMDRNSKEKQWGVYRLHDGVCAFLAFPEPPADERAKFYSLTSQPMKGKDGTLWFGTFNAAFGFNGESWDIIGRARMGLAEDPRYLGIRGYHMDSKGNLWMADNGVGLFVYDGSKVIHFTDVHDLEDKDTEGNSLHRAFCVEEDDDGNYWFGSVYSGLWRYEPSVDHPLTKGTFTNFDADDGWPCQSAWTIYKSRSGELLFAGENPGGVYRFDGAGFERVF